MYCTKCGEQVPDGNKFCSNCGTEVLNITEDQGNDLIPNQPVRPEVIVNNEEKPTQPQPKKKNNKVLLIVLIAIGAVVILIALALFGLYKYVVNNSSQMICTSNEGDITIIYNDDMIIGYTANGFTYDLDGQREYAEKVGIDAYLEEFNAWFENNTTGTCKYNKNKTSNTNNIDTKTVGDNKYGYVDIPKDWVNFQDLDGNDSLQFSYGNIFIVTLNYYEETNYTAKELAQNYMYSKQQSDDVEDVTGATLTIGDNGQYTAYQIYMYYPKDKIYLITYWFEAEDGKVHYMALEGPEEVNDMKLSDFLSIPESFRIKQ